MTPSLLIDNLLAWSAQVALLTAAAAPAALLLVHSRARLLFWQAVLAAILFLPAVQPWMPSVEISANGVSISMGPAVVAGSSSAQAAFSWNREYLLIVIASGALLRLLWIAIGFIRLRGHRLAASTLAHPPVPFERDHVRWYISPTISGPVTFGWLRPSILLPSRALDFPADLQESIACHELVHVERADWLFVLSEELIRAVLWFHPAIWFVLSRIQLAREQTVDREVIALTGNRDRYLEALMAVAEFQIQPDVAPAPLFLKQRQLAARVADLFKETRMSKPRLIATFTTVGTAALVAARLAVWFFPLQAPAQSLPDPSRMNYPDGPGISVDPGAPLMHRAPVSRGQSTASGTVTMEASINSKGEVTDARVIGGPDELRKSALQSVLQWHYSTLTALPPVIRVTIRYDPVPLSQTSGIILSMPGLATAPPATIKKFVFSGATPEMEQQFRDRLTVREGDTIGPDTLLTIMTQVRDVDEHFGVSVSNLNTSDGHREATVHIALAGQMSAPVPPPPPGPVPMAIPATPSRIRVGGNVQQVNLIAKVTPSYPPDAKEARIQGTVKMTAIINKDGTIQSLSLISGHPMLASAAMDAVKQWIYKPTLLNGNPVEVITQIDVNFTLSQ